MTALKIAMVAACPFPANRGTPSRILAMSEGLALLGHEVHVVTYHFGTNQATHGITVHRTPKLPYHNLSPGPTLVKLTLLDPLLIFKLLAVVRDKRIDVIHAHHFEGALVATLVGKITGITVIYDAHTTLAGELSYYHVAYHRLISRFFDRRVPAWADQIISVSDTIAEFLIRQGIAADAIDVVPTGVVIEDFEGHDPEPIRRQYQLHGRKIAMYTGTLAEFQGIDYLLDAMAIVLNNDPAALLLCVGDGDIERYRQKSQQLQLADRILFIEAQPFSSIPAFLAAADVVVIPRTECPGIPQKLTNYMAAAKAIVSFAGSAKILVDGENGLVIEDGNVAAMADAISRLLNDRPLRQKLGDQAKESLRGKYDWTSLSKKIQDIYRRILA